MNKIDFKKEQKELYSPTTEPSLIHVPAMKFIMVKGKGNPNDSEGEYSHAVQLLYALSYHMKMTHKKSPTGCDYVVAPLEGLWWLEDSSEQDFTNKDKYHWISMIRQPDFITPEFFETAKTVVAKKKPELNVDLAKLELFEEGLCIQCMHLGPYATEPETISKMDEYAKLNNLKYDIGTVLPDGHVRRHHEIYLSDPKKVKPEAMKTILRHPVR